MQGWLKKNGQAVGVRRDYGRVPLDFLIAGPAAIPSLGRFARKRTHQGQRKCDNRNTAGSRYTIAEGRWRRRTRQSGRWRGSFDAAPKGFALESHT